MAVTRLRVTLAHLAKILCCMSAIVTFSFDQSTAEPSWVKRALSIADTVTAHKDASYITLFEEVEVKFASKGKLVRNVRVLRKILKSSGRSEVGVSELVTGQRKVKGIKGWLLKSNGNTEKLKKENIFEVALDIKAGYYDDRRLLLANLPDVEPGDITAFEYRTEESGWTSFITGYVFQTQEPVVHKKFTVQFPKGWQTHIVTNNLGEISLTETPGRLEWIATNLAYREDEPYMSSWGRVSRAVSIACYDSAKTEKTHFADWSAVGTWCSDIMRDQAVATEEIKARAIQLIGSETNPRKQIELIGEYVRDEIRYVAVEIGKGGYVPRKAHKTLANRFGDCKDKSTLMRSMLGAVGISSSPALANMNGATVPDFPTAFQFDHCIIAIPQVEFGADTLDLADVSGAGWVFFDPTDDRYDLGSLSGSLRDSYVLPVVSGGTELVHVLKRDPAEFLRQYVIKATLNADGSMSAHVRVVDSGDKAAVSRSRRKRLTREEQIDNWRSFISEATPTAKLENFVNGDDGDSVWVSFDLSASGYAISAGNLLLLRPNPIHEVSTVELTKEIRNFPVWFGDPYRTDITIQWKLPDGYELEKIPEIMGDTCALGEFHCSVSADDSTFALFSTYSSGGKSLDVKDYDRAQIFERGLSQASNLTLALVKK